MKTLIVGIGIGVICALSMMRVNAQGIHIGIQGIPQFSWMMNQDDRDNAGYKYLSTFNGAYAISSQVNFTPIVGIGVDAIYSFQGQRYEFGGIERFKKVEYLKIPVMLVYTYDATPVLTVIGKVGPQAAFLTNAKLTDEDGDRIIGDHKNAYENFEFGIVGMGGVGVALAGNLFLDLMLRLDYGFTDAENKDYTLNINNPVVSNEGKIITNRAMTNNATAGLAIGIRYVISK